MTLNPNAAEFVPSTLKPVLNVGSSRSNERDPWPWPLNRNESAKSGASDDEFRQYWRDQLPDDIIPDFGMMAETGDDRSWEHNYGEENLSGFMKEGSVFVDEAGEVTDPLEFLAHEFPGFAVQNLADVLQANGGDLNLTIDMLTQLEIQDDNRPVNQSQSQIVNLTTMDFPSLTAPEISETRSRMEDDMNALYSSRTKRPIGVEDFFSSVPYSSGSNLRGPATDFVAAVRKNMNVSTTQWQREKNERNHSLNSDVLGAKFGSFSNRCQSTPVWLETGEAVSNMYDELREEARDHARVRNAYFEQARQAYLSGNKALAKDLSTKGQHFNALMKEAHTKAGEAIFQQRNGFTCSSALGQPQLLDLHGLHVNEAIPFLKRSLASLRLAARASQQQQQMLICVGTGHHTKGSRTPARLPIAVEKFLVEDECLPFTEQQPGMLRVVVS